MRLALALSLIGLLVGPTASADPRGSLELGVTTFSRTVVGEAVGESQLYSFLPAEPGYGLSLGVDWAPGATVRAGAELWLSLVSVATRHASDERGAAILTHIAPRVRLEFPLGGPWHVDGLLALGPGFVSEPRFGSLSLNSRLGVGLGYRLTDETAVFAGASHLAVIAWPTKALVDDFRVKEPLFFGQSALLLTIGVRGLR